MARTSVQLCSEVVQAAIITENGFRIQVLRNIGSDPY